MHGQGSRRTIRGCRFLSRLSCLPTLADWAVQNGEPLMVLHSD